MKHPAKSDGEIFLGNHEGQAVPPYLKSLQTVRTGSPAYCLDGRPVPGMVALFINQSDSAGHEAIMMRRLRDITEGVKYPRSITGGRLD